MKRGREEAGFLLDFLGGDATCPEEEQARDGI